MHDRSLSRLTRHLARQPEDLGAWVDLAHLVARTDAPPPELPPGALGRVAAAWARAPGDRDLARLALPLLGATLPDRAPAPGAWWLAGDRIREADGHPFDAVTGFPLALRDPSLAIDYRLVPPGEARLGDDPPTLRTGLPGFYMARHPVTARQYQRFREATGHPAPTDYLEKSSFEIQLARPDRPVVFVSFHDACACATYARARVPSGEEWERAARGPDARPFPWGGALPDEPRANFNDGVPWRGGDWDRWLDDAGRRPAGASPFGIEDMAGNVREWTTDPAPTPPGTPRRGAGEAKRVLRGGSWAAVELGELHVAHRDATLEATGRADDLGFRLVKDLG